MSYMIQESESHYVSQSVLPCVQSLDYASLVARPIPCFSMFHAATFQREALKSWEWAWGRG